MDPTLQLQPLPKPTPGGSLQFKEPPPKTLTFKKPGLNLKPPPKPLPKLQPKTLPKPVPKPNLGLLLLAAQVFWEIFDAGDTAVADLESLGINPSDYNPPPSEIVVEEGEVIVSGGQEPGVRYVVTVQRQSWSLGTCNSSGPINQNYTVTGPVRGLAQDRNNGITSFTNKCPSLYVGTIYLADCVLLHATDGKRMIAEQVYHNDPTGIGTFPFTATITNIVREDGLPDNSGDLVEGGSSYSLEQDAFKLGTSELERVELKKPKLIRLPRPSSLNRTPEQTPETETIIITTPVPVPVPFPVPLPIPVPQPVPVPVPQPQQDIDIDIDIIYEGDTIIYRPGAELPKPQTKTSENTKKPDIIIFPPITFPSLDEDRADKPQPFPFPFPIFNPGPPKPPDICKELELCFGTSPSSLADKINDILEDLKTSFLGAIPLGECYEETDGTPAYRVREYYPYTGEGLGAVISQIDALSRQLEAVHTEICSPPEKIEYVSIVAAPEVQHQSVERALILDLVRPGSYLKRDETGKKDYSKWRIQIPNPIDDITWDLVKNIVWMRGQYFCRMSITNFAFPIQGYFASKQDANDFFDLAIILTKEQELNRTYNEHVSPRIAPVVQLTQVYRGYVVTLDPATGEPQDLIYLVGNETSS